VVLAIGLWKAMKATGPLYMKLVFSGGGLGAALDM
jgi:hypothetical protein